MLTWKEFCLFVCSYINIFLLRLWQKIIFQWWLNKALRKQMGMDDLLESPFLPYDPDINI